MQERRQFLRIDDDVIFSYRPLEAAAQSVQSGSSRQAALRAALTGLDQEIATSLAGMRERAPQLGEVLDYLSRKMNLLARLVTEGDAWRQGGGQVNLSAGGMAFETEQALAVGSVLEVELVLLPSCAAIHTRTSVVACQQEGATYHVSLRFDALSEREEDLIVHHVLRKHSESLRQRSGAAD